MRTYTVIEILAWYLGGWNNPIKAFTLIIVVGIIAEAMVSIVKNNNLKRLTLMLFSQKIAEYILIGMGNTMDIYIVEGETSFRELIIVFYATYECLKILHNAAEMGLPVPNKIKKILECIFDK
ncbi:MAG: phage holin family protein [Ruminococcus sp.]|nr:phage holin family protein [Ruminococcus sp.]